MSVAVLYPHFDHPALEERYASWQAHLLLRGAGVELQHYDPNDAAREAVAETEASHVLVITDPLILVPPDLPSRLRAVLGDAFAALPLTNEPENPSQQASVTPYLTLRELQEFIAELRLRDAPAERLTWDGSDPGVFLCAKKGLDHTKDPLRTVLNGREVVISHNDYVHRWPALRGQVRTDLLERISHDARSVLEFGCGEGSLGEELKRRQKCRVVGIELDPAAAAIARKRIDDVYTGDVREIVSILNERFDWIVGGEIVEHLDEPWSFLADLRHVCAPGGYLLLSIPNVANAAIVSDLLAGRFDYVYMGLTCVGHVRFFTRKSIEDLLAISGWKLIEMTPQSSIITASYELVERLTAAGIEHSREDLLATGYYVVAQNPA
jgi:2-polyprenyl-3-methyl-5-hydroxy-6-metoxy-1,4-benzoquinol methylase